jgi:hypothetical protein
MTVELREFIEQRTAEDEAWARAASAPYRYAEPGAVAPEGGAHWTWAVGEDWTPVTVDPDADEFVGGDGHLGCSVTLRTVEEWRCNERWSLPVAAANTIVEFRSTWAGHIVRHDPARVLQDIEAVRRVLRLYDNAVAAVAAGSLSARNRVQDETAVEMLGEVLRALAAAHAEHPDYREDWRP